MTMLGVGILVASKLAPEPGGVERRLLGVHDQGFVDQGRGLSGGERSPMLGNDCGGHPGAEAPHAGGVQAREEAVQEPGGVPVPRPTGVYRLAAGPEGGHHLQQGGRWSEAWGCPGQ